MATTQEIMVQRGIVTDPDLVIAACTKTGLGLHVQCAVLQKESYGGRNVFGNDRVAYPTSGPYTADTVDVTRAAVDAYLAWRGPGPGAASSGRQNGVGPNQLTYWDLQDDAERRGGLHLPGPNMETGCARLKSLLDTYGGDLREAAGRYNGGSNWRNNAGAAYAEFVVTRSGEWQGWLAGASTAPPSSGGGGGTTTPPADSSSIPDMREGDVGAQIHRLAGWLNRMYPSYSSIPLDSNPAAQRYGPTTTRVMAEFQRRSGVTGSDAVGTPVGPRTKAALWSAGYRP